MHQNVLAVGCALTASLP